MADSNAKKYFRFKDLPVEIQIHVMEHDAINALSSDLDEESNGLAYAFNRDTFVTVWQERLRGVVNSDIVEQRASQASTTARPHQIRVSDLFTHQPFAHPFGPTSDPTRIKILPSFAFVRKVQLKLPRSRKAPLIQAIDKVFAVSPCLREFHLVLLGLQQDEYLANDRNNLSAAAVTIQVADLALRANKKVPVKILDFSPEYIGNTRERAPYDSSNPRRVRIHAGDLRSYLEQVQPLQMRIDEFPFGSEDYLLKSMNHIAHLKMVAGFEVDEFRWVFDFGQEIPDILARAAWVHPKLPAVLDPERRLKLRPIVDDKVNNRLHLHRPGRSR